jgi:hypothetical protein
MAFTGLGVTSRITVFSNNERMLGIYFFPSSDVGPAELVAACHLNSVNNLQQGITRSFPSLRTRPGDIFIGILNITGFAVQTIGRIEF